MIKELKSTFTGNYDKTGMCVFTQLQKDEKTQVYLYERKWPAYTAYEVFISKLVLEGAPLPGGGKVEQSYRSYLGTSLFGRGRGFSCSSLERAQMHFKALVDKVNGLTKTAVADTSDDVKDENVVVGVIRRGRKAAVRPSLVIPSKSFKMKDLVTLNEDGWTQPTIYVAIQKMIGEGSVTIVGTEKNESGRGKKSVIYSLIQPL